MPARGSNGEVGWFPDLHCQTKVMRAERVVGYAIERIKQRFRVPEIGRVETFGEPPIDGRKKEKTFEALLRESRNDIRRQTADCRPTIPA